MRIGKTLSAGEIALGAALLAPCVPAALAGAGLVAFSGGLLADGLGRGSGASKTA